MRAQRKRAERRRNLITIGVIAAVAAVIIGVVAWYAGNSAAIAGEVIPPGVSGTTAVQAAAHQAPDTSGIPGVVAYVTTGWPQASHNGPAAQALAHEHVAGPVTYSVTPARRAVSFIAEPTLALASGSCPVGTFAASGARVADFRECQQAWPGGRPGLLR